MYACNSSRSLAIQLRLIDSRTVEGIGAALGVDMGLICDVGMGIEGSIVEVEVGGTAIGSGPETAALVVSPVIMDAF